MLKVRELRTPILVAGEEALNIGAQCSPFIKAGDHHLSPAVIALGFFWLTGGLIYS